MNTISRLEKNANDVAALARLVRYCESEATGLQLPFVAYCLSIAKAALVEDSGCGEPSGLFDEDFG